MQAAHGTNATAAGRTPATARRGSPRRRAFAAGIAGLGVIAAAAAQQTIVAQAGTINPSTIDVTVQAGQAVSFTKEIKTTTSANKFEVCILADESGSTQGRQLSTTMAGDLFAELTTGSTATFAVGGFRDYPNQPNGVTGDWVYRQVEPMTSSKPVLDAAIARLTTAGGGDALGSGYDSIVGAVGANPFVDPTLGSQKPCGFSSSSSSTKVLLVSATGPFHSAPTAPYVNDEAAAIAALGNVHVIGLTGPSAGTQLANLATATGGTTLPITANGTQIGLAIKKLATTAEVTVSASLWCDVPGLTTTFSPASLKVKAGETAKFTETINVTADVAPGVYDCVDLITVDGKPLMDDAGRAVQLEKKRITVL